MSLLDKNGAIKTDNQKWWGDIFNGLSNMDIQSMKTKIKDEIEKRKHNKSNA